MNLKNLIPSIISSIRIILSPLLFYCIIHDQRSLSFIIFLITITSDYFDGFAARKLKATSHKGAYLDVISDFVLILSAFSGFIITGILPIWILFIIILMFLQFIITSKIDKPVYDPVGKYYGSFLFACMGIILILPLKQIIDILLVFILVFSSISILSRFYAAYRNSLS